MANPPDGSTNQQQFQQTNIDSGTYSVPFQNMAYNAVLPSDSGNFTLNKRLNGIGHDYLNNTGVYSKLKNNKDINPQPFPQTVYTPNFHHPRQVGTSKIRRTASEWTAYKLFLASSNYAQSQLGNRTVILSRKLCNCNSPNYQNVKKQGLCPSCLK